MALVGAQEASNAHVMPLSTTVGSLLSGAGTVAVVGSREYPELHRVEALVERLPGKPVIVSGGAKGVDRAAVRCAQLRGLPAVQLVPEAGTRSAWVKAALARDQWFGLVADVVVAFWNGKSSGTKATIAAALRVSGKCVVVLPGERPAVWVPRI